MKAVELFVDAYTMMEMLMYVNRALPMLGRGRRITRKNFCPDHALVAQLDLERVATNDEVVGSNPARGTNK